MISLFVAAQSSGIPGFGKSGKMCKPKKIYHPPELPRNFKPIHKNAAQTFSSEKATSSSDSKGHEQKPKRLDANDRSAVLGETPHFSEYQTQLQNTCSDERMLIEVLACNI